MSDFQRAMLLRLRCELEQAITDREGMIAANLQRQHRGESLAYDEKAFDDLAKRIAGIAPDPHSYS